MENITSRKPTKKGPWSQGKITLFTFLAFLTLIFVITGFMIFPYLLALATGVMLALLTFPLYRKLIDLGVFPRLASGLLTLAIIALAVVPISLLLMLAIKQGIAVIQTLMSNEEFSAHGVLERISKLNFIDAFFGSFEGAKAQLYRWIQQLGSLTLGVLVNIATQVPNIILQLVITMISYFYFLVDGKRFIAWIYERTPLDIDVRKKIVTTFADTTISVIWATLAAAVVQALIMFVAFLVLSVPAIFLATAATFIFAWIPILGSTPVWIAGAIYLYFKGSWIKALIMILFGVATGISDNFVRPLVLQGKANMHPLVSIVAIFGGIGIFGILGVFIGPIIAAVLTSLLQIWPVIGQQYGYMRSKA